MKQVSINQQVKEAILNPHTTHMWGMKLPSPQGYGTSRQRDAYATLQAHKFIDKFNNNKI